MPSVVQFLCDPCYAKDRHVEGDPVVLAFGGESLRVIFCSDCRAALVTPLEQLTHEFGVKVDGPGAGKRVKLPPVVRGGHTSLPHGITPAQALDLLDAGRCLFSTSHGPFANRGGAVSHMRNVHQVTVDQLGLGGRGQTAYTRRRKIDTNPALDALADGRADSRSAPPPPEISEETDASLESGRWPCDQCDRILTTPQGLGSHKFRAHGVRGMAPETVARRERNGEDLAMYGELAEAASG